MVGLINKMNSKRIALVPEESPENSESIVYAHDLSGNMTFVNKEAELISGYSRKEARLMNITQFIAPEFLAHVRERFNDRAEDELGTVEEIDIIAKDGRRVALEVSTRMISRIMDGRSRFTGSRFLQFYEEIPKATSGRDVWTRPFQAKFFCQTSKTSIKIPPRAEKTKAATSSPRRRFPSATVRLREDETFSLILVGRHCTSISPTMLALKQILFSQNHSNHP